MPRLLFPLLALLIPSLLEATQLSEQQRPTAAAFESMRMGVFTHMVYGLTIRPDGGSYGSIDEFADNFDVEAYADKMREVGAEYVIFTAWHLGMYNLGPNKALEKWLPGHTAKRDLIGEVADALHKRGIKLIIYAHPNDGHDLKPGEKDRVGFITREKTETGLMPVFNDFINEVYAEMVARYADKPNLMGFWWDGWLGNGRAIDMPRLRQTMLRAMPRAISLSNFFDPAHIDYLSQEAYYNKGTPDNIDNLIARHHNQTTIFGGQWWCNGLNAGTHYSAETLYRFTVLNACAGGPGGMAWALSPAGDGRSWSPKGIESLVGMGRFLEAVRPSVCGVAASPNWPVADRATFSTVPGYGATRSLDGSKEYLHVLRAPEGKTLEVTTPLEHFKEARLLANGHPVQMANSEKGLRLTLSPNDQWDPLHTVIVLERDPNHVLKTLAPDDPSIVYSEGWGTRTTRSASRPGNSLEVTFTGTKFAWWSVKGQDRGMARVSVDGAAPVTVDCYSAQRIDNALCYSVELPEGKHTVRIEVAPDCNPVSKGRTVEISKVIVLESK